MIALSLPAVLIANIIIRGCDDERVARVIEVFCLARCAVYPKADGIIAGWQTFLQAVKYSGWFLRNRNPRRKYPQFSMRR